MVLATSELDNLQSQREIPDPAWASILDTGEIAAIQLASEMNADYLLMDKRVGHREATRLGIREVGALGILEEAHRRGLTLDAIGILIEMQRCGFRVSKSLLDEFRRRLESVVERT